MLKVYQATDVGCVRTNNEDSLLVCSPAVYGVADGMGGCAGGEVASRLLVDTVESKLTPYAPEDIGEAELADAIRAGNEAILARAQSEPQYKGMGTTATLLHVIEQPAGEPGPVAEARWAHVGDSRLYLIHDSEMEQLTRDHSYVEELVAQGTITEQEAQSHPQRNLLTRAVGVEPDIDVDTGHTALAAGDILLLATDGLTKLVSPQAIKNTLTHCVAQGDGAAELIRQARIAGGTDNITAVVVVLE